MTDFKASDWKAQIQFEDEGFAAGKDGKTRNDCPYNKETEPNKWNHWVFGCENATVVKSTVLYSTDWRGPITLCSTEDPAEITKKSS